MKRTVLLLVLVLLLALSVTPGSANAADPPLSGSVLVRLMTPTVSPVLPPSAVPSAFTEQAYTQAMTLLPVLNNLKKQGHIAKYDLLMDANSIRVEGLDLTAALLLSKMPGVTDLAPAGAESVQAARANFNKVLSQTRAGARDQTRSAQRPAASIWYDVRIHETWDFVEGYYNGGTGVPVQAVLYDSGGTPLESATTTNGGDYFFHISFWGLPKGDIVGGEYIELSVGGGDRTTIKADKISISFDWGAETVSGNIAADRDVEVKVWDVGPGNCGYSENMLASHSDVSTGDYTVDFTGQFDINARVEAEVSSIEDNDLRFTSVVWRHSPFVRVELNTDNGGGWGFAVFPNDTVTLRLMSGGIKKDETTTQSSYPDAKFGFRFNNADILPTDTIEVEEDGGVWATIPISLVTTYMNPTTNLVTGKAPAGQPITISGHHYNRATGDWVHACRTITTPGTGQYSVSFGPNYVGRDNSDANYVVDPGNELHVWDVAPYFEMNLGQPLLGGNLHNNFNGSVNIVVKNALGVVKYSGVSYAFAGRWEQLLAKAGARLPLAVNDRVTITPSGGTAMTAVVGRLTAAVSVANHKIAGTGPANTHIAVFDQRWQGGGFGCSECWANVVTSTAGAYSYTFKGSMVTGDYVLAALVDANGNQTIASGFSTPLSITMGTSPTLFRTGRPNIVNYTIGGAEHVQNTFVAWDYVTRPDVQYMVPQGPKDKWWPGTAGNYTVEVYLGSRGTLYFRAFAYADGRWVFTPERSAPVR